MPKEKISCIADVKSLLGEGPVWVPREQALYWVDIKGRKIFRLNSSGRRTEWDTPFRVGSLAPRTVGGFIAGTDQGFASIDPQKAHYELIGNPEEDRPNNRFNDGKVDRFGNFWAGSMDDTEQEASGALYRVDHGRKTRRMEDGYRVTNGPAFSPGGRIMYHADSARQVIYAYELDEEGELGEREVFARFSGDDGYPDGMTVDEESCLWVAFWDGWCIRRFAPSGECIQTIEMPVQRPTSCAFGGPNLDKLYVTSACIGLDELALSMQPYAGGLFLLKPGARGIEELPFAA